MRRLRLLDMYCCAGGAARGYQRAKFHVTGVDIRPQPRYAGDRFLQADCLSLDPEWIAANFDAVHASPICQGDTVLRHAPGTKAHPDLITPTRQILIASGLDWIMENVEGARPRLRDPICLCGTMFGLKAEGCDLHRHRLFESSFPISAPSACRHSGGPVIGVYGGHARKRSKVHGGRSTRDVWANGHRPAAAAAMGMDWATLAEMSEAIPPAYTEHLGHQLSAQVQRARAA